MVGRFGALPPREGAFSGLRVRRGCSVGQPRESPEPVEEPSLAIPLDASELDLDTIDRMAGTALGSILEELYLTSRDITANGSSLGQIFSSFSSHSRHSSFSSFSSFS